MYIIQWSGEPTGLHIMVYIFLATHPGNLMHCMYIYIYMSIYLDTKILKIIGLRNRTLRSSIKEKDNFGNPS